MKKTRIILFLPILIIFFACNNDGKQTAETTTDSTQSEDVTPEEVPESPGAIKTMFHNLPSPIETASLMKRAGATFDVNLMNSTKKVSEYSTNLSKALNLGVYSADLSYSCMFDQSQSSVNYLATCKNLASELGIHDEAASATLTRMETNIANKDSSMQIITETLLNSDSFLKENEQASVAAIILAGGWLEGLYIAVQTTKAAENNEELREKIIDQRLSFNTLMGLLEEYSQEASIATIVTEMSALKEVFDKVVVTEAAIETTTDSINNVTILDSDSEASMSDEALNELYTVVESLRTKIIEGEVH